MVLDQIEAIEATLYLGLSSARVEAINAHLRLIARRAYGFHSPDAMIALAMLRCGSVRPLPCRFIPAPSGNVRRPPNGSRPHGRIRFWGS